MALTLKLTSSTQYTNQLTLTDTTGAYAILTNPGGWGAPNLSLSNVRYAHLLITSPEGELYDVDIISDLGIDFATATVDTLIYNITYDLIGGEVGTVLTDGVYTVIYQVSSSTEFVAETGFQTTFYAMTYYNVQSDVLERIADIPTYYASNTCDNLYIKETTTLFMLLQSLILAATYTTTENFEVTLGVIEDIIAFDSANTIDDAY